MKGSRKLLSTNKSKIKKKCPVREFGVILVLWNPSLIGYFMICV